MAASLDGTRLYAEVLSFHPRIAADPHHTTPEAINRIATRKQSSTGDRGARMGGGEQWGERERERDLGRGRPVSMPGKTGATAYLIASSGSSVK
jgi:hypothetical protein